MTEIIPERGNSLEDDRSLGHIMVSSAPPSTIGTSGGSGNEKAAPARSASPPTIHLSPSRQSSSSTDHGGENSGQTGTAGGLGSGLCVAKKKRELFSARSSRSGGSNKSSTSDYSREASFKPLESSSSSGHSHSISISQSQEETNCGATNLSTNNNASTTTTSATTTTSTTTSSSTNSTRTITRTQSAGEASAPNESGESSGGGPRSSPLPPKRSRMLRRQDCLEKGMDLTTDGISESTSDIGSSFPLISNPPPQTIKSSPNSPLLSSFSSLGSPPHDEHSKFLISDPPPELLLPSSSPTHPASAPPAFQTHPPPPLLKQKSQPDPAMRAPSPYYSLDPVLPPSTNSTSPHHLQPPPPMGHHRLPSVRVIPDPLDPMPIESPHLQRLPVPNMRLLCPPEFSDRRPSPLVKPRSTECNLNLYPSAPPQDRIRNNISSNLPPPSAPNLGANYSPYDAVPLNFGPSTSSTSDPGISTATPTTSTSSFMSSSTSQHQTTDQFGHCPKARDGPALGCNYCWNTSDNNGRILRRKTKYHCPECQANLCIVPCFQQYHEALEREKGMQGSQ